MPPSVSRTTSTSSKAVHGRPTIILARPTRAKGRRTGRASARAIFIAASWWSGSELRPEGVRGQVAEERVPRVAGVLFDLGDHRPHLVQHRGRLLVVDVALEQLEHVEAVA